MTPWAALAFSPVTGTSPAAASSVSPPVLRPDAVVGGIQYHDAQVDDARHTMTVARTAAAHGADLATRTQVTGLLRDSSRVQGVRAVDLETGRTFEVRARAVVSTTGVWTDDVQALVEQAAVRVRTSKGVHLIVPRQRFDFQTGLVLRAAESVLFIIPWGRHWLLGTTDTDWAFDRAHPAASRRDVDYILTQANRFLVRPLTVEDVQGVYAGLRPLLDGESETT